MLDALWLGGVNLIEEQTSRQTVICRQKILFANCSLQTNLPLKIHHIFGGMIIFIEIKLENAALCLSDRLGEFERIAGIQMGDSCDTVAGSFCPAFQLGGLDPAKHNGFNRLCSMIKVQLVTLGKNLVQGILLEIHVFNTLT